jgi:hypothetical protein
MLQPTSVFYLLQIMSIFIKIAEWEGKQMPDTPFIFKIPS